MKKFINEPKNITAETLEGLALANGELLSLVQDNLVVNKKLAEADRVTVVALGGSGNEPAFSGFVGEGMIDVAVIGDVFAGAGPNSCLEAIKLADKGHGVLLIVGNHTGDTLAASLAVKQAVKLGLKVAKVVVQDDIAVAARENAADRRGLVGCVPLCKIAGAAAAAGKPLEELAAIVQGFADNMATIAVASGGATSPVTNEKLYQLADGVIEVGVGEHGEAGKVQALPTADQLVVQLLDALLADLNVQENERLLLIINGSGATTLMEQLILFRGCHRHLAAQGIEVTANVVGELLTVQEGAGFELFIARMDEDLLALWHAPCRTPYYKN